MNLFITVNCGVMLLSICQTLALVAYFRFGVPHRATTEREARVRVVQTARAIRQHVEQTRATLAEPEGPPRFSRQVYPPPPSHTHDATLRSAKGFLSAWSFRGPPATA